MTVAELIERVKISLPEDHIIRSDRDALVKAAYITEELGEVVKDISRGERRGTVKECSDAIVGLLQVMDYFNDMGEEGVESAFEETLARIASKKKT